VVLAALDAKKGEVFAAAYDAAGAERLAPRHVARADARSLLDALGPGAPPVVVGEVAAELPELRALLVRHASTDLPDAAEVARLGALRLARSPAGAADAADVEPVYVRAPDAKPMAHELG
jgi:tRNA A37 threonylcarbamoyladenosine modification protein TsaB